MGQAHGAADGRDRAIRQDRDGDRHRLDELAAMTTHRSQQQGAASSRMTVRRDDALDRRFVA